MWKTIVLAFLGALLYKSRDISIWMQTPQQRKFSFHLDFAKTFYQINESLLPESLKDVWVQTSLDAETHDWLETKARKSLWSTYYMHYTGELLLKMQYTITDVAGIQGRDMYVFSQETFRKLLPADLKPKSIMDYGAGFGTNTEKAMAVLGLTPDSVYTTEVSDSLIHVLQRRGFHTVSVADVHNGSYTMKFDFIMCLNVLDRVDEPKSLLKVLTESIAPHGHLMLGVVLPFCGGVERGTRRYGKPTNPLAEMQGDCPSSTTSREPVEKSLVRFVDRVLPNFNLELLFATRVPYFSSGDIYSSWYLHTEFLLTCKLKSERPNEVDRVSSRRWSPAPRTEDAAETEL